MSASDPQKLGEFEIIAKLGHGGMGAVYKARQISLGRLVALKVLPGNMAQDDEFIVRFKAEARSAAALNHPGIVQVYAAGEEGGVHYFAMEFVDGESLHDRLKRKGRLAPPEALAICAHVATALQHGWNKARIIHRDIKPDNIFLSREGAVKLGDLGLAKSVGGDGAGLTQTGTSMGTPFYISPEQAHGDRAVDFRSDIYSLGCTLYHLVSGQTPYTASSAMAVMIKHITEPPPDILRAWPECPPPIPPLLARLLAKNPDERVQSYDELITALMAVHEQLLNPTFPPAKKSAASKDAPLQTLTPKIAAPVMRQASAKQLPQKLVLLSIGAVVLALFASLIIWAPWKKHPTPGVPTAGGSPAPTPASAPGASDIVSLFNGQNLDGWKGDPRFWSVRNGAIVGEATAANPTSDNTFLIWQGGPVENFVFEASFILSEGNSGVQYRSRVIDAASWVLGGYQCDLDATKREWRGAVYEERGTRGVLAPVSENVRWRRDGTKEILGRLSTWSPWRTDDWNRLRITAQGNRLVHEINGLTVAEVIDEDPARQSLTGVLGLQLLKFKGANIRVQFRDLQLKRLPAGAATSRPVAVIATPPPSTPTPAPARTPAPATPTPTPIASLSTPTPTPSTTATTAPPGLTSRLNSTGGLVFEGASGPGLGKHIVLLAGDEEYRSEEMLPQLAKILAAHHGFKCTALFSTNPQTGEIDPNELKNMPGLDALADADLCVMLLRFRNWPEAQMKHFADYYLAGKPFIALRTSTHAFNGIAPTSPYAAYNYNSLNPSGGFGRQVLGESWLSHWGQHKAQATRALPVEPAVRTDPILRGVITFTGSTDVYEANPPADAKILLRGQVLSGMTDIGGAANGRKKRVDGQEQDLNNPMMPVAWTREVRNPLGKTNKVFTCTMGTSAELQETSFRRLLVNAAYWSLGLEVPQNSRVTMVGEYRARDYGFNSFAKGLKPADFLISDSPAPGFRVMLFNGRSTAEWRTRQGTAADWPVFTGAMEVGLNDLVTLQKFQDFQMHAEFWIPKFPPEVRGQARGNSGIFLQGRYEVQILDSFGLPPGNEECGALYKQRAPIRNACTAPETWQSYDITFRAARFDAANRKTANARVTVVHNGRTIHDNVELIGTSGNGTDEGRDAGPIVLQSRSAKVRFRNLWIIPQ